MTKNSDVLLEKMVVHGQFLSIKLRRCADFPGLINSIPKYVGAMLMKMAILVKENASRVVDF